MWPVGPSSILLRGTSGFRSRIRSGDEPSGPADTRVYWPLRGPSSMKTRRSRLTPTDGGSGRVDTPLPGRWRADRPDAPERDVAVVRPPAGPVSPLPRDRSTPCLVLLIPWLLHHRSHDV